MWKPGDVIAWRGIYRHRVWHAIPTYVVKDTLQELVLAVTPGTNGVVEEHYASGKKDGKRRWDFQAENWRLANFTWHTNRLLFLLEPEKYYSTIFFWNHDRNEFLGYYINFQLPFKRSHSWIDTLDLELDLNIHPDFSFEWKDLDDYKQGIKAGIIHPDWVNAIEVAILEVLGDLEKRKYPFDGSWLDWMPDPNWTPAKLPENWDLV
jgi:predicted RNA-binding protein associated with RNAse of E/G family